eukprot:gnl/TRDRNA2_/TRDRNA2_173268_c1_seq1.p1 gnl/TRDRNA2_/TRDRNA2_173268_c1~~gnl/TRDRNA2_/TRDRNA2_173268_c1_seq1.p1  ORF type:complete len:243 (+),score=57.41 gnl/TRDRNA2_/TRDRNA2_173268_c1_seq1:85-813(+)
MAAMWTLLLVQLAITGTLASTEKPCSGDHCASGDDTNILLQRQQQVNKHVASALTDKQTDSIENSEKTDAIETDKAELKQKDSEKNNATAEDQNDGKPKDSVEDSKDSELPAFVLQASKESTDADPFAVDPYKYPDSMTATIVVEIGGKVVSNGNLIVFDGVKYNVVGRTDADKTMAPPFGPKKGTPMYMTMIYGKSFSSVLVYYYVVGNKWTLLTPADPAMSTWVTNANIGNALTPTVLKA